jgi:dephospho-CoA kinase
MRIIGLTGGIASGKSFVAGIIESCGAVVVDADQLARKVVEPGRPAYKAIVEGFGDGILLPDGSIDRKGLGRIVFADIDARRTLERITHPAIAELAGQSFARERQAGTKVVFYVVPLLFETGMAGRFDEVWVVNADDDTQIGRLMARDGIGREEALSKMSAQMPMAEKLRYADVVIDNTGSRCDTERHVRREWSSLMERVG